MNQDIPIFKKFSWDAMENCTNTSIIDLKTVTSPVFEITFKGSTTKWHLEVTPRESNGEFSLNLIRNDCSRVMFSLRILLCIIKNGKVVEKKSFRRGSQNFKVNETPYYRSKYSFDVSSRYISEGKLTVGCEMIFISRKDLAKDLPSPSVSTHIQKMYEKELFTDFELRCKDGVSVKCHKSILAARSPVFEAMLSNDTKEARQGFVDVPEYDSKLMKEVLCSIYCGWVKNIKKLAKTLIVVADKYDIKNLKEICITQFVKELSKANVVENLKIVDKIGGCIRLFEECFGLVKGDFTEISKTEGWKELSEDMLKKIAMLEDTKIENIE